MCPSNTVPHSRKDLSMTKAIVTPTSVVVGATSSHDPNGTAGTTHGKLLSGRSLMNNNKNNVSQEDTMHMNAEIDAAVSFLTYLLVKAQFSTDSAELFRKALTALLRRHYLGHWYPQEPLKGSGYRCLRVNGVMHPLLAKAVDLSKLPFKKVRRAFPAELTVWVDPGDVSVRFGEEGSIGVFYAKTETVDQSNNTKYQWDGGFTSDINAINWKQQQQQTTTPTNKRVSPPTTNSRSSPIYLNDWRTPPSSKSSSTSSSLRRNNNGWNQGCVGGRHTPTSSSMLNGSNCGTTASSTYGFRFEDHQFRVSPTSYSSSSPSPAAVALSNETCKIEYQLYGNVHIGSNGMNGAGRLTPSIAMGARMEPVSAN